ncbi:hypothetical protein KGM48_00695 [Patescibacteria group bacterium]|nr:hypothetical protein [Patescibacteria group bacterium]
MSTFFALLLVASVIGFILSFTKPELLKSIPRSRDLLIATMIVAFLGYAFTRPLISPTAESLSQPVAQAVTETPITTAPAPATDKAAPTPSSCTQAILASFPKVTAAYAKAYKDGKDALGTSQYPNSSTGLQALTVPGSAASNFSAWRKTWSTYEPSFYDSIVKAYTTASDCYSGSNQTEPDALGTWRDDMAQLDSDLNTWGSDAIDWQVSGKTTAQLMKDETSVDADFALVQKDFGLLK